MKLSKLTVLFLSIVLVYSVSAKKGTLFDSTDQCIMAKEICDYAWETQKEYEMMPDSTEELKRQKNEFKIALNTSIFQCEKARKECVKSVK